jgi:hemin uptake protein HemP
MADPCVTGQPEGPNQGPSDQHPEAGQTCQFYGIEIDAQGVRRTTSHALLGMKTELQILHRGETYRLTLTRTGKLLLQK